MGRALRSGILACAVALAAALAPPGARADDALTLWYDAPARDWEREGLPIGNGAMGAMIMGGVEAERIQLNEKTLWTGGPGSARGYDFGLPARSMRREIDAVRRDLARGGRREPEAVARRLGRTPRGYGDYQTFGDLVLDFAPGAGAVSNYRRELDLAAARARVSFDRGGAHYVREYFASYPDRVIVVRLSADRPGRISFAASFAAPDNRTLSRRAQAGRITAEGALRDNGLRYAAEVQIIIEGGARADRGDGSVSVEGADAALIVVSAGTNYALRFPDYRGPNPVPRVRSLVDAAAAKGFARLSADHEADYRALFDRVRLDIGQIMPDLPTDALLARYGAGAPAADRALEALYFQYGRYLLIASSRAGSLPANLQGVWNNSVSPPWNADYHVNINLQMNYWLAETTNLPETAAPLFDFIDALAAPGRLSAARIYGARGWTLFLNSNIWGFSGLIAWPTSFWQPEAGAWLAQHYYEHYRFGRDEAFLRTRAYPVMKGAAEFWLDALSLEDGRLVVSPSYSPEHGPFSAGAAMSQQIVFDLFTNVAEAAARVGDEAFRSRIEAARARLDPGLNIGSWGQLQEWRADWDDRSDDHRHVSHLFALHPGRQISPLATPAFAEAARVSLNARGDGGTGWSKAWKINFWARLLDGARAHRLLAEQLRGSTLPNLLDTHPPFQIDGNFGATAGVAEMLVQSQHDEVHILPALPPAWASGTVRGLRARGDLTIDIRWAHAAAAEASVSAGRTGPVTLRSAMFAGRFTLTDAASGAPVAAHGAGQTRTFQAEAGRRYVLRRQD